MARGGLAGSAKRLGAGLGMAESPEMRVVENLCMRMSGWVWHVRRGGALCTCEGLEE